LRRWTITSLNRASGCPRIGTRGVHRYPEVMRRNSALGALTGSLKTGPADLVSISVRVHSRALDEDTDKSSDRNNNLRDRRSVSKNVCKSSQLWLAIHWNLNNYLPTKWSHQNYTTTAGVYRTVKTVPALQSLKSCSRTAEWGNNMIHEEMDWVLQDNYEIKN